MKACSTCKESMKNCIDTHSFAFAHLYSDEKIHGYAYSQLL